MKKIILIICVILVTMVSCKKEEAVKPTNTNSNYPEFGGEYTAYRSIHWSQGIIFCEGHGTECIKANPCTSFQDVMVSAVIALDNAISNNTVADFFTNGNWSALFPDISVEHLSLLQKNRVTLVKHDNGIEASPRYIYLAYNKNNVVVFAMEIPNL